MSWVHCNKCFFEPGQSNAQQQCAFFLTSCSHISCQKCHESAAHNVCTTCKKEGIKSLKIDSSMNKHYRQYFVDISSVITSKLDEMGKTRKFQDMQIQSLVKGTLKFQDMVRKAQEMMKKYETEYKRLKRENQDLRAATQKPAVPNGAKHISERPGPAYGSQGEPQRSRSRTPNLPSNFDGSTIPPATFHGFQSEQQRSRSRTLPNRVKHISERPGPAYGSQSEPQRSRSSAPNLSSHFDGSTIPPATLHGFQSEQQRSRSRTPDFRVTFDAGREQRTRSKSPSGCIQGTIKKGSILIP